MDQSVVSRALWPLPLQILQLLSPQEVMSVVPDLALVPRTFVLKPSMSLFVGGLARVDFLEVMTSSLAGQPMTKLQSG